MKGFVGVGTWEACDTCKNYDNLEKCTLQAISAYYETSEDGFICEQYEEEAPEKGLICAGCGGRVTDGASLCEYCEHNIEKQGLSYE